MVAYSKAELEERDPSVELYLLNYWIRDFSLRDLIDRVAASSVAEEKAFLVLFSWLMSKRANVSTEDKWIIEDFRKLALLLSKNLRAQAVIDFFSESVQRFGKKKVSDFMEIQLMHNQTEYNIFIHWFHLKFRGADEDDQPHKQQVPHLNIEEVKGGRSSKYDDAELRDALQSPMPQGESVQSSARPVGSAGNPMDHSRLYKQLREQRKFTN